MAAAAAKRGRCRRQNAPLKVSIVAVFVWSFRRLTLDPIFDILTPKFQVDRFYIVRHSTPLEFPTGGVDYYRKIYHGQVG